MNQQHDTQAEQEFDFRLEFADSDTTPLLHVSTVSSEFLNLGDLLGEPVSIPLTGSANASAKLPRL
jgi:hypothetical protein